MRAACVVTLFVVTLLSTRVAWAGAEWVLILDNSSSMSQPSKFTEGDVTRTLPPSDPDRLSIVATLIFRALLDRTDRLTILTFDSSGEGKYREVPNTTPAVRAIRFDQMTPFKGPLRRARDILANSSQADRALLVVTDGLPSDINTIDVMPGLLGLGSDVRPFEVIALALSSGDPVMSKQQLLFLQPLGKVSQIASAKELVKSFTEVFAAHIRSRPQSGRLEPAGSFTFPVGRYVSEVLVNMASEGRTGPFEASLTADGESITPTGESGDNGCESPPCHAWAVLRAPHDPQSTTRWTLRIGRSSGAIAYGVILRYELGAEILRAPSTARLGEEIEVAARMTWRGRTFDDKAFFAADGFQAQLLLGDARVPLLRSDDATFVGKVRPAALGASKLRARFYNHWLDMAATADVKVEGYLPLELRVRPSPIDFGGWTGERTATRRCVALDFAGSTNHRIVPFEVVAEGLPQGLTLEPASPLKLDGDSAQVCVVARGCCGDLSAGPTARLLLRGKDPHYHPTATTVALAFHARQTPFLRCWWRVIAGVLGTAFLIFVVVGFVKPRDFDSEEVIRLAKTEPALARALGRRLRELPGGRRGFYRDARVSFDGSGTAVRSPRQAVLTIRAAKGDPIITVRGTTEIKDPRTRKWQPITEADSIRKGMTYRSGDFCFRLG